MSQTIIILKVHAHFLLTFALWIQVMWEKSFLSYVAGRRNNITLAHVLQFATGAEDEPVLGFSIHPSIIRILWSFFLIPANI